MYSQFFLVTREAWQLCSVPELTQPPAQSLLKPGEGAPGWRRRGTLAWEQKLVNGRNSPCESGPGSFLVLWEAASWKVRAARDQDSGWKGACSRWNLPSLSVLICRMGIQSEVSHWGVVSGRMMAVRARPTLRQQTSQGWLVAVPSSELWAGPQRRGHSQAQCDASGFSQV